MAGDTPNEDSRNLGFLERICPVRTAIDVLHGRWKPSILEQLNLGPSRYSELLRVIPGISPQAMSLQLRQLMADDIIEKSDGEPVVYSLTSRGAELGEIMDALALWGEAYLGWRESKE